MNGWRLGVVAGWLTLAPGLGVTADETNFAARAIELEGIHGEVSIMPGGSGNQVQWRHAKGATAAFNGQLVNGVVRFSPKPGNDGGSSVNVRTEGGVTVVESGVGNRVSVNVGHSGTSVDVRSKPPPRLELVVPKGTTIRARQSSGKWRIGDVEGPVEFSLLSGEADIGRVGATMLLLDGAGEIRVSHVTGNLKAVVDGSGSLHVNDGRLEMLRVTLNGTGDVHVGGVARQAEVALNGTGNIDIARVAEKPVVMREGVGDVIIGGWER
ncbi:MAG: DUF2807 domain-containing protein [Magnetococcales bacterium]|nr:DUF2807 domain-containing protein [Magnetococcales bacterium]